MGEERLSWKESNLEFVGSDIHHKVQEAAAQQEEAWQGLGETPILKIWRIEQFIVVPVPEETYGKFFQGDTYIILNSYEEGEDDPKLLHDVHIWIGNDSTQDEYGAAAYKMVELDDFLGGAAIQHREVEGQESALFNTYFDHLIYLEGGVASGFNHVVEEEPETRLYEVFGGPKEMHMRQRKVCKTSLNAGNVFVLVKDDASVFQWNGESSSPFERNRANVLAEKYATLGTAKVIDQGDEDEDFWDVLEDDGDIGEVVKAAEIPEYFSPALYKLTGEEIEEVLKYEGSIRMKNRQTVQMIPSEILDSAEVYLLDAGWEIFVWIGKGADSFERMAAPGLSDKYCKKFNRPLGISASIVKQGFESKLLKSFLLD